MGMMQNGARHGLKLPSELFLVFRTFAEVEGLLRWLYVDFDVIDHCKGFAEAEIAAAKQPSRLVKAAAEEVGQWAGAVRPNWVAQIEPETVVAERAVAGMDARRLKPSTATKICASWPTPRPLSKNEPSLPGLGDADMARSCRCSVIVAADFRRRRIQFSIT